MVISNIILSKGHDASEHKPKTNNIMTYVSEMTEGQTLCHAGSCDKAEDCRSGIGHWYDTRQAFACDSWPVKIQCVFSFYLNLLIFSSSGKFFGSNYSFFECGVQIRGHFLLFFDKRLLS